MRIARRVYAAQRHNWDGHRAGRFSCSMLPRASPDGTETDPITGSSKDSYFSNAASPNPITAKKVPSIIGA